MKKLLLFTLVVGLAFASAQAKDNKGAIKHKKQLHYELHKTSPAGVALVADVYCDVYVLSKHWLIASSTCSYPNDEGKVINTSQAYKKVSLSGDPFTVKEVKADPNVNIMLLRTEESLLKDNEEMPLLNILGFSDPLKVFALPNDTFFIRRKRTLARRLRANSLRENTVELEERLTDLSGKATMPLLFRDDKSEFLVGYNAGQLDLKYTEEAKPLDGGLSNLFGSVSEKSKKYFLLSKEDLQSIYDAVGEEVWNQELKERAFVDHSDQIFQPNTDVRTLPDNYRHQPAEMMKKIQYTDELATELRERLRQKRNSFTPPPGEQMMRIKK